MMKTNGFGHYYVETHNWVKAVAFWQHLGFEILFDTGHGSGMLRHPSGGTTVYPDRRCPYYPGAHSRLKDHS